MTAQTLFDNTFPRMGAAYTPFSRKLGIPRRKRIVMPVGRQESGIKLPKRSMYLGHMLSPDTGKPIGKAYLPFSSIPGINEAINVFGASGSGKSVLMRSIIEYFAIEEHRCVIILDVTKNQYWSFGLQQNRENMLAALRQHGMKPTTIPEVEVYVPIYDEPVLGFNVMQRDFHATRLLSIKTAGLTAQGFFELGDIDASGRMYQGYLEAILNVPRAQKTIEYIQRRLGDLAGDKSKQRSIASLINIFQPICEQGIIRDNGTDIREMLHTPRNGRPGKICVISMGTSSPNDRRKKALISSLLQQLFDVVKDDLTIKPVLVTDETKEIAPKKESDSPATYAMWGRIHLQCRAWGVTRISGFQEQNHVADYLLGANTPIQIAMTKSLTLADGVTKINDTGLGHIFIEGVGDPQIPDMNFLAKFAPSRTRHVD